MGLGLAWGAWTVLLAENFEAYRLNKLSNVRSFLHWHCKKVAIAAELLLQSALLITIIGLHIQHWLP